MAMLSSRADIIDVGAVSTRPGAADVSVEEEWRRLEPFLKAWDNPRRLSIDTTSSEIASTFIQACILPRFAIRKAVIKNKIKPEFLSRRSG